MSTEETRPGDDSRAGTTTDYLATDSIAPARGLPAFGKWLWRQQRRDDPIGDLGYEMLYGEKRETIEAFKDLDIAGVRAILDKSDWPDHWYDVLELAASEWARGQRPTALEQVAIAQARGEQVLPEQVIVFDGADEGYKDAHLAASVAGEILVGRYTWTPEAEWQRASGGDWTPVSEEHVREQVRRWLLGRWREARQRAKDDPDDPVAANTYEQLGNALAVSRAGAILQYAKGIMLDAAPTAGGRVALDAYLDGVAAPPEPAVGALRDDGRASLYPGRWHTLIGPTEAGKTWAALAHVRDELAAGRTVAYVHFEEDDPAGTLARLTAMGVPADIIRERFVWLSRPLWRDGNLAADLAALDDKPSLVVLDGVNAACSRHGQDVEKTAAVGWYRNTLVTPATRLGAAVLSLGHPTKARDRQTERHGYGSTAWLDEVDGVAFRLKPGREPIRRGTTGTASLHVVKDRYGAVSRDGTSGEDGWTYVGSLVVDDSPPLVGGLAGRAQTAIRITAPSPEQAGRDAIDGLADHIEAVLSDRPGQRYESQRQLEDWLAAAGVTFPKGDVAPALERMQSAGRLAREPFVARRARPGWLNPAPQDDQ